MSEPRTRREPIPKEDLSDEQRQTLQMLCREGPELKAAFNRILSERGIKLELIGYELGNPARLTHPTAETVAVATAALTALVSAASAEQPRQTSSHEDPSGRNVRESEGEGEARWFRSSSRGRVPAF